jgi:hypothetical protein
MPFNPAIPVNETLGNADPIRENFNALNDRDGELAAQIAAIPAGPPGSPGRDGIDGQPGSPGRDGVDGQPGVGVPAGGASGQVLAKASATDHDTQWVDASGGGGPGTVPWSATVPAGALVHWGGIESAVFWCVDNTSGAAFRFGRYAGSSDDYAVQLNNAAGVQAMLVAGNTGENAVILGSGSAHDVVLRTNNAERLRVRADGAIFVNNLPTEDPHTAGQLWNNAGVLNISAG